MFVPFHHCILGVAAVGCLAGPVSRVEAAVLLDFEIEADLRLWHYEGRDATVPVRELALAEHLATSGRGSLRFASPAWKQGLGEWPAFEGTPPLADWSGFDRLSFDVTNVTAAEQKLFLFISDSKIATRSGWLERAVLPACSYTRVVVPLAKVAEKRVDLADIHVLHFFTERPPADMEVYIDRLVLLPAGEPLPAVSDSFLKEFAPLHQRRAAGLRQQWREAAERVRAAVADAPELEPWTVGILAQAEREVAEFAARSARADASMLDDHVAAGRLLGQLAPLEARVKLRASFARVRAAVQAGSEPRTGLVVGFATSMEKVLPRAMSSALTVSQTVELSLARNEKEGFQIIVLPCERDLKGVRVRATDLEGPAGSRFAAANVRAAVVGYVETKSEPPYGTPHVGWWPDPILTFQAAADIARGDAQAFWVRARAPRDQPAGLYRGKLEVEVDGATAFRFDLSLRVFGFSLPDSTPLPLAVTFWPMFYEPDGKGGWREGWYNRLDWQRHKWEWADLLADYYLTTDTLYGGANWTPDFDSLAKLKQQGRLGRFNLGYYGPCGETPEEIEKWRKTTLEVIRPRYQKAKELGLLGHAYIYGCDEHPKDQFPGVERAAAQLKQAFPGVLVMTTTYDHSFGQESVIKSMDAFCPLTPSFDAKRAAQARAAGKQVWWYICCGPHHPHANMFIEYPAVEGRLLMGAMTAKYRPDGFLYYETSIWNSPPIAAGPFTDWDPRSWTTYHGDGSWTCLGPGGMPLPTIRLENFRDGLEDFAYVRILEATIAKVEATPGLSASRGEWLQKAKALLTVPEELVKSLTEYSRDPAAVYAYRTRLADAIEAAGIEPAGL